jgi:hypothetical protein
MVVSPFKRGDELTVHHVPTVNQSLAGETWSERQAAKRRPRLSNRKVTMQ